MSGPASVYRCLAAGIRQRTTDCERCSVLRTRPNLSYSLPPREHCWGGQIRWAPVSSQTRTRPRENQVWVANGWCERVSDLLCTIPLHRPTCILQTESRVPKSEPEQVHPLQDRADLTEMYERGPVYDRACLSRSLCRLGGSLRPGLIQTPTHHIIKAIIPSFFSFFIVIWRVNFGIQENKRQMWTP